MTPAERQLESETLNGYLDRSDQAAADMRAATARAKATKEGAGLNASPQAVKEFNDAENDWKDAKARYLGAQVGIEDIRKLRAERKSSGDE